MKFELTNEEKEAIELYKNGEYQVMNQLLVSDSNSDISLIREDVENESIKINYDRETLIRDLNAIKVIYELLQKVKIKRNRKDDWAFIRGTNVAEVERFKTEMFIDKPLDASIDKEIAEKKYALSWNEPAVMYIRGEGNIPYLDFSELEGVEIQTDKDILISPFTKLKSITNGGNLKIENKVSRTYNVMLEKQELQGMPKEDKQNLYINILGNSDFINLKINEIVRLEKESNNNYENIRKLEQLIAKYEVEVGKKRHLENYSEYEIKVEEENLERLKREVAFLKQEVSELYEKIKECTEYVTSWKKNITVYVMSECYDIDVKYQDIVPEESNIINIDMSKEIDNQEIASLKNDIINQDLSNIKESNDIEKSEDDINSIKPKEEINTLKVNESMNIRETSIPEEYENNLGITNLKENTNIQGDSELNNQDVPSQNGDVNVQEYSKPKENLYNSEITDLKGNINLEEAVKKTENNFVASELNIEANNIPKEIKSASTMNSSLEMDVNTNIEQKRKPEMKLPNFGANDGIELVNKMKEATTICKENAETIQKITQYIHYLLLKQQNHAKLAGIISARYSALNNCFEMRKQIEALEDLNNQIYEKMEYVYNFEKNIAIQKLDKILKVNTQVSTLLNYLNNPKSSVGRTKINRFEEMAIIEENEFKRNVADLLRDIRGEAELKKLKDDLEIIEDKNPLQKFLGIFTGRNKLDEAMIEQIIIRQDAIRKSLARNLRLDYNYSIHELVAETEMFIRENEDDELIEDEVKRLKIIEGELKENFVILEEKIKDIINEREGRNLPIDDKITREELVEIETRRFLRKYRYDEKEDKTPEIEYQDTTANEIYRIIEYIKTSNVLSD